MIAPIEPHKDLFLNRRLTSVERMNIVISQFAVGEITYDEMWLRIQQQSRLW